jgi:hypothetical protein
MTNSLIGIQLLWPLFIKTLYYTNGAVFIGAPGWVYYIPFDFELVGWRVNRHPTQLACQA